MIFRFVILSLIFGFGAVDARGLAVSPMEQFALPGKSVIYYASNRLPKAVAVEVVIEEWTISEDGREILTPSKDFIAYPFQFILKGNTVKNVKVGPRDPKKRYPYEKTFRVTIKELPISLDPEEPGTYRIYQASAYKTSLYIASKKARPDLKLVESKLEEGLLSLRFHNQGSAHIHLRNPLLRVQLNDGKEVEIKPGEIFHGLIGENMHAQIMRHFVLDLSKQEWVDKVESATLQFLDGDLLEGQVFKVL